jgi:hypothetical protein
LGVVIKVLTVAPGRERGGVISNEKEIYDMLLNVFKAAET